MGMYRVFAAFLLAIAIGSQAAMAQLPTLRVGVLKFGTVNWELQTIKSYGLDRKAGFNLEVVPFAGKQATTTALHGGAVDVIVNDWIWVSRQRHEGRGYGFIPYSNMVGALVVKPEIRTLADLKGRKLGVAGGPVDKSWLLFQALAKKQHDLDLPKNVEVIFGAPPLLSKKLETGELDGLINFWHYIAKLEVQGFRRLMDVSEALNEFGLRGDVPMIGYVFSSEMVMKHKGLMAALCDASRNAKSMLQNNPNAWEKLRPLMKAQSEKTFLALKDGFIAGIPANWGDAERLEAARLYEVLAEFGGERLVGKSSTLDGGTFIDDVRY